LPPEPNPMPTEMLFERVIVYLSVLIGVLLASHHLIYQSMRKGITQMLLNLAEHVPWFACFREMKD
jgi:hypothetical protein